MYRWRSFSGISGKRNSARNRSFKKTERIKMNKTLIAGNWKMNKTTSEAVNFIKTLTDSLKNYSDRDVLVCPPFTSLTAVFELLKNSPIKLGAQNVDFHDEGAFTGEISPGMLKDVGVEYVICGHSERREIFGESDSIINKKVLKTVGTGMIPILCIGESLQERENEKTFTKIKSQLENCLTGFETTEKLIIAYEPIWAIGTGKTATPQQAEEVHEFIRKCLSEIFDEKKAKNTVILYGGSVKPDNINDLMKEKDIDGALVGGASLKVDSFLKIIDYIGE
jgi:triosephosphate isomerase (TIM)